MHKNREHLALLLGALALLAPGLRAAEAPVAPAPAPAAAVAEASADEAFDFFLKEAEVVTASRRAQKKSDSPVAIDVITREEIEKSGALNLWDLLRFRVGLDVAENTSIEGNPVQVNVRGLPNEFSQSLQVLVDGRSIVSGINAGIFWRNIPAELQEIERIEIVRGPNSALFGSNSGQGVINIITRKPVGGGQGEFHASVGRDLSQLQSFSMEAGSAANGVRLSVSDRRIGSNPQVNGDTSVDMSGVSLDRRINARGNFSLWEDGEAELFGGLHDQEYRIASPASPISPVATGAGGGDHGSYLMAQVRQKVADHALELNVSRRDESHKYSGATSIERVTDADLLTRINLLEGKSAGILGGSWRRNDAESGYVFDFGLSQERGRVSNTQRRIYASESLSLVDWATLVAAGSLEASDMSGQYPAYQGAVILKPTENHNLRLSGSRSPSMPSLMNKKSNIFIKLFDTGPFPSAMGPDPSVDNAFPGFSDYPVGIIALGHDVKPTQVSSYEATWSSSLLDRRVLAEVTYFHMEIDGIINFQTDQAPIATMLPFRFAPLTNGSYAGAVQYVYYDNTTSAVLRGVETVLTFKPVNGTTLQVNHTYEDVYFNNPKDAVDPFEWNVTPWNKVNVLASTELPWGFNASGQLGWVGKHVSYLGSRTRQGWIEDQGKLDLRLGYKPTKDVELYATALNLGHALRTEGLDGTAAAQTYFGGVNVRWGN